MLFKLIPINWTSRLADNAGIERTKPELVSIATRNEKSYISLRQMLLSGGIAGGEWAIQLSLAWFRLGDEKWRYYREMGMICAIGSSILVPYIITSGGWEYFLASLIGCVVVMAGLICWRLSNLGLRKFWVPLWFGLLAVAVTL